jgi:hypothetical protein
VVVGGVAYVAALAFIDPRRRADLARLRRKLRRSPGPGYA